MFWIIIIMFITTHVTLSWFYNLFSVVFVFCFVYVYSIPLYFKLQKKSQDLLIKFTKWRRTNKKIWTFKGTVTCLRYNLIGRNAIKLSISQCNKIESVSPHKIFLVQAPYWYKFLSWHRSDGSITDFGFFLKKTLLWNIWNIT